MTAPETMFPQQIGVTDLRSDLANRIDSLFQERYRTDSPGAALGI